MTNRYLVSWKWVPTIPTDKIKARYEEVLYQKYWDAINKYNELLEKDETNYYSSNQDVKIFTMELKEIPTSLINP
jgi:hypothetical protein